MRPTQKPTSEGGTLQNMVFCNLVMQDVERLLFLTFNHRRERVGLPEIMESTGKLRNIIFENITATTPTEIVKDKSPIIVMDSELNCKIENIRFHEIVCTVAGGGTTQDCSYSDISTHQAKRAEFDNYKWIPLAYGIYARNVEKLQIDKTVITPRNEEKRPIYYFDHCKVN